MRWFCVPVVLLATLHLACGQGLAPSAHQPASSAGVCPGFIPQLDPVCMFSLQQRTKNGDIQGLEALTSELLTCFGYNQTQQNTIRVLSIDSSTPEWNARQYINSSVASLLSSLTGIDVTFELVDPRVASSWALDTTQYANGYYSLWVLSTNIIPNFASQGRLEPLDQYVLSNRDLEWIDLHRFYRTTAIYNGTIAGMPLGGRVYLLYYRKDILDSQNIPVPATWDDLVLAAQRLNGSDFNNDTRSDYALCFQIAGQYCSLDASVLIGLALAPQTQVKGSNSGWLFDPDALNTFVDTEAMNKTLRILSELATYSWPSTACYDISPDMWAGRCAMTISSDATFKQIGMRRAPNPWRGRNRILMAPLPGSHEVLDRQTGKLMQCLDTEQCPHARPMFSYALNRTVLVNQAPGVMNTALIMLNTYNQPIVKASAANVITVIAGASTAMTYYFSLQSSTGLTRYKQLQTDPRSLALWQGFGFNTNDVIQFLRLVNQTLDHGNIAPDLKALNAYKFKDALELAAGMVFNLTAPETVQAWLSNRFTSFLAQTPRRQFAESLWVGLNLQRSWAESPVPPLPPMPTSLPQTTGSTLSSGGVVAIVVPCATVVLLLVMGGVWALRHGWMRRGPSGPPGMGPSSTLVVTDVEESTQLWETLPMHAMDEAIRLHHSLIRKLLAKHYGYESATEGDAFIMGFHTARQAVQFACDLQQQLMTQPWPEEVLKFHVSAPVWAQAQSTLKPTQSNLASVPPVPSNPLSATPSTKADSEPTDTGPRRTLTKSSSGSPARLNLSLLRCYHSERGTTVLTAQDSLNSQWRTVDIQADPTADIAGKHVLAYRGLRLRLGLHTGLTQEDVITNKTTGGLQYTGHALALAKAVADSGQGGMTLLSLAAFEAWKHESAGARSSVRLRWGSSKEAKTSSNKGQDSLLIIHMGCYAFNKAPDIEPCAVYWAVLRDLECRLALGRTTLRNTEQLAAGVLQAPIGSASVVFCTMVGYSTLLARDKELAQDALAQYTKLANALLSTPGGAKTAISDCSGQYLLEQADGLNLAVFGSPAAAIMWGLRMIEEMKEIDWPAELLSHELCESVVLTRESQTGGAPEAVALFHGPRVKVGIDTGAVTCDVSPATARLAYRGRPMNRAARVVDKVPSGQVWCTAETVAQAGLTPDSPLLRTEEVGTFTLKGLSQPLTLHQCMLPDDNLLFSAHQSVRSGPSRIDSRIGSRIDSRIGSRIGSRIASRINSTASHGSVTRLKAGSILAGPAGAQKSLLEAPRLGSWASGASPALAAPQLEDDCEDERSSADGVRISVPEAAEGEQ